MNQLAPGEFAEVEGAIRAATDAILAEQRPDGHWVYELEADATIPAEYVLLVHYLAETPNLELERKIGVYLRRIQGAHGGWPLYHDGAFDISATVKAYFALKMIGDDIDAPHMARAREAILARGGAIKANVFTRILLALYGQTAWAQCAHRAGGTDPAAALVSHPSVEDELLGAHRDRAAAGAGGEAAAGAQSARRPCPGTVRAGRAGGHARARRIRSAGWSAFFSGAGLVPEALRAVLAERPARAAPSRNAATWTTERLNGEDGLGAIYPAMANSVMMYDVLGYPPEHPDRAIARKSVEKLLVIKDDEAYCQPCVSPVWDTALVAHALLETEDAARRSRRRARAGMAGAAAGAGRQRRLGGGKARCAARRLGLPVPQRSLSRSRRYRRGGDGDGPRRQGAASRRSDYDEAIARGAEWVEGLQSRNGGWGAFDADNSYYYLNNIPFADHGALLDPPTEDVSGRCVGMIAQLGGDKARLDAGRRLSASRPRWRTAPGSAAGASIISTAPGRRWRA